MGDIHNNHHMLLLQTSFTLTIHVQNCSKSIYTAEKAFTSFEFRPLSENVCFLTKTNYHLMDVSVGFDKCLNL
jgi:hypothetical protein